MRAIIATVAVLALAMPAQAWQFTLDQDRGQYLGEVFHKTGSAEIGARCFSDYPDERELYLLVDARLEGGGVNGVLSVAISAGSESVTLDMQVARSRGRLSLVASSFDNEGVQQVLDLATGSASGLTVDFLNAGVDFPTSGASAAFRGFDTVCNALPSPDSPFARPQPSN